MDILMIREEIEKKGLGKGGQDGRVRLAVRRPRCLVLTLVDPQRFQVWFLVSQV